MTETIAQVKELFSQVTVETDPLFIQYGKDGRSGVQQIIKQTLKRIEKQKQAYRDHTERLSFEMSLRQKGNIYIAGVDEVGRGPLAGPVVTASVILPENCDRLVGINDSKQLSHDKRLEYELLIKEVALAYTVDVTDVETIDRLNIYQATRYSMKNVVSALSIVPQHLLIDAMELDMSIPQTSLIKGDQRSLSIAAASILAKVHRDRLMLAYHELYPEYGFNHNMGYGTSEHLMAIEQYGITPIHRRTFKPVSDYC